MRSQDDEGIDHAEDHQDRNNPDQSIAALQVFRIFDLELEGHSASPDRILTVGSQKLLVHCQGELAILILLVGLARNIITGESDRVGTSEALFFFIACNVESINEAKIVQLELILNKPVVREIPGQCNLNDEHFAGLNVNVFNCAITAYDVLNALGRANFNEVVLVKIVHSNLRGPLIDVV